MPRITVEQVEEGLHPSEVVVTIRTADGKMEEVAVDRQLVEQGGLRVYPVSSGNEGILVELPRETLSGIWRVLMPKASVSGMEEVAI